MMSNLFKTLNTSLAANRVRIDDVRPFGDLENALAELCLHRVADVGEFSILENEKIVFVGELDQFGELFRLEVVDYVDVGLEYAYVRSRLVGQLLTCRQ